MMEFITLAFFLLWIVGIMDKRVMRKHYEDQLRVKDKMIGTQKIQIKGALAANDIILRNNDRLIARVTYLEQQRFTIHDN